MGCFASPFEGDYLKLYRFILIESDVKNIGQNPYYLISTDTIPIFIKIINESKILEYKHNQSRDLFNAYERNLFSSLESYTLEKNIKIFYNFEECRNLANENNEKGNEFIIVDQHFLDIMQIEKEKAKSVLINYDKNKDGYSIYFQESELNLGLEFKKTGICRFINQTNISKMSKFPSINYSNNNEIPIIKQNDKQEYINPIYDHRNQDKSQNRQIKENGINNSNNFNNRDKVNNRNLNLNRDKQVNNKLNENGFLSNNLNKNINNNFINYANNDNNNFEPNFNPNLISNSNNNINNNLNIGNSINNNNINNSNNNINISNNININQNNNIIFNNVNNNQNNNMVMSNDMNIRNNIQNISNNNINMNNNQNNNFNNMNMSNDMNFNQNNNNLNNFNNNQNNNFNNINIVNNVNINNQNDNFNNMDLNNNQNNKFNLNNNEINMMNNLMNNNNINMLININRNNSMNNMQLFQQNQQLAMDMNNLQIKINNSVDSKMNQPINNNIFMQNNNNQQFMNNKINNLPNSFNNFNNMNMMNNNMKLMNNVQQPPFNNNNQNGFTNNLQLTNNNMNKAYLIEILKFPEPPLIGLENIGATCYMNATLQCLSNINLLTGFFLFNKNYFSNISYQSPEKPISKAFSDVIYHLWNPNEPNKYYAPHYFKNVLSSKNKLFEGIQANDSKDLLIYLFEEIHKELNILKNNKEIEQEISDQKNAELELIKSREFYFQNNKSIITDLFYFDQCNITTCMNCGAVLYNFSMQNVLIFPLEKTRLYKVEKGEFFEYVNLKDCFDCHINPEQSQQGNVFYCNTCHQESRYILQNKISSFPEILTIVLNRGTHLEFDVEFMITYLLDFVDEYLIKLNSNKQDLGTKYELIGIIIHTGNSGMDGHFFTYCRSPVNKKWYWFNDAMVKRIKDPIAEIRGIPYLLFYQKTKK